MFPLLQTTSNPGVGYKSLLQRNLGCWRLLEKWIAEASPASCASLLSDLKRGISNGTSHSLLSNGSPSLLSPCLLSDVALKHKHKHALLFTRTLAHWLHFCPNKTYNLSTKIHNFPTEMYIALDWQFLHITELILQRHVCGVFDKYQVGYGYF